LQKLKVEDLDGCDFRHVYKFLMSEGLTTGQDRAHFMKVLYFYQLADWNGWTGWHPEIVADYVWTINLQQAWGTERQKQRGTKKQNEFNAWFFYLLVYPEGFKVEWSDCVRRLFIYVSTPSGTLRKNFLRGVPPTPLWDFFSQRLMGTLQSYIYRTSNQNRHPFLNQQRYTKY